MKLLSSITRNSRVFLYVALLGFLLIGIMGGCATPEGESSSIPWNKPEPWEKKGMGVPY